MRDKIYEVLQDFLRYDDLRMRKIYYGVCTEKLKDWNYFVFNRIRTGRRENASYNEYYDVNIVCENYIPDGMEMDIVKAIREATMMRLADNDIEYNYVRKPNTEVAVEICTIHFVKARKGTL